MPENICKRFGRRVGYTESEIDKFYEGGHRVRHVRRLAEASPKYSILAKVIHSKNCNSAHLKGQTLVLDVDGNLITKLCPKKLCVYLISQLSLPVALINERLSEGLNPNDFHFMRYVRCPDVGVDCYGYGEVTLKIEVVPRMTGK